MLDILWGEKNEEKSFYFLCVGRRRGKRSKGKKFYPMVGGLFKKNGVLKFFLMYMKIILEQN